jgi:hypothetical protein
MHTKLVVYLSAAIGLFLWSAVAHAADTDVVPGRWSAAKANAWYQSYPWLVGSNYITSTAINQLEMFQADTFDLPTIDRELGYAQGLGFTSMRVFLHDLLWQQDSAGFLNRLDQFLAVADKHHIRVMFVLFDSCWDPYPKLGKQHDPKPHVHNSGWVQSPGIDILNDPAKQDQLKGYVQGVIGHFAHDKRVVIWDLFNESDNTNDSSYGAVDKTYDKAGRAFELMKKTYAWAREMNPDQPLTTCVWKAWQGQFGDESKLSDVEKFDLANSDVISFHCYDPADGMTKVIENLKKYGRPLICTEYMARPQNSTFATILPLLKHSRVAAYNWGFVSGKSQTIYPWDSWGKTYTGEPPVWFHDIFRADGTPYKPEETALIRRETGKR